MKKNLALFLCIITLFCALTITSSAATTTVPVKSQDVLDYYQMAVGNEYVVYGRGTLCSNSDISFLSMVVAGNVSNTYIKAVYSDLYYTSSSYTHEHILTTKNASTNSSISGLSYDGNGTRSSSKETYVERVKTYTSSTRPSIRVTATIQAVYNGTIYVSHPNVSAC